MNFGGKTFSFNSAFNVVSVRHALELKQFGYDQQAFSTYNKIDYNVSLLAIYEKNRY